MTLAAFRRRPSLAALATAYRTAAPVAEDEAPPYDDQALPADVSGSFLWEGVIGIENQLTGDGRLIEGNALRWEVAEGAPVPFRMVTEDIGAHAGAVVCGSIFTMERRDGGLIWATGDFDRNSEEGVTAQRLVAEDRMNGVSMDLDDVSFEVRIAAEVYDQMQQQMDEFIQMIEEGEEPEPEEPERDSDGNVVVAKMNSGDELMVTTSARIRTATLVSVPAFADARIRLREGVEEEAAAIVASAARTPVPVDPPRAWFDAPSLTGPTPIKVLEDGRVFGHLATWDVCHIASPNGAGVCVTAPHSATGYAHFLVGELKTAEGEAISVGTITMNTTHAPTDPRTNGIQASAHYDHTGLAVADVRVGEDVHGIWVAGAIRPGLSAERLRTLRASPLSGDWRTFGGNLELIAAVAVNTPGFPIPRPKGLVASGALTALVASGMIAPTAVTEVTGDVDGLDASDVRYLRSLAQRGRRDDADALRRRVSLATARSKVAAFARTRNLSTSI